MIEIYKNNILPVLAISFILLFSSCSPEEEKTNYSYCVFSSFEVGGSDNVFGISYEGSQKISKINVNYSYDFYALQYEEIINTEYLKNQDVFELIQDFRSLKGTYTFTYNSAGKVDMILKQVGYYDGRNFFMVQEYYYDTLVYNSSGQLSAVYRLPERKKPLIRHEYAGGVLAKSYINSTYPFKESGQYEASYTYDAIGNVTQREVSKDGSVVLSENYVYDGSRSYFFDKSPEYLNLMWLLFPNYVNFHDFYTPRSTDKVVSIQRSGSSSGGNLAFEYGDEISTGDLGSIYMTSNGQQVFHVEMNYACE